MSGLFDGKQLKDKSVSPEKLKEEYLQTSGGTITGTLEINGEAYYNGIEIATVDQVDQKADQSDTYTKDEIDEIAAQKQDNLIAGDNITIDGVTISSSTPIALSDEVLTYDVAGLKANLSVLVEGNEIKIVGKQNEEGESIVIGHFNVLQSQIIDKVEIKDGHLFITFIVDGNPGTETVDIDLSEFIDVYVGSQYIDVNGSEISLNYNAVHDKLINDGMVQVADLSPYVQKTTTVWGRPLSSNVTGNLTATGSITPGATNTHDIGSTTARYKDVYAQKGDFTGTVTATGGFAGNATSATTAASCTGNSATATKLATLRTISLTGGVTGSATFDGSADKAISTSVVSAPKLTTARTISLTGGVTGSATFDGSSNTAISTTVVSAPKLTTARNINGTSFDGSAAITTANWGTSRYIQIGTSKKSVNGGADVNYTLEEIGAATSGHNHDMSAYALKSEIPTGVDLSNYATKTELTNGLAGKANTSHTHNYATTGHTHDNYVKTTGDETIAGVKRFSNRPNYNGTNLALTTEIPSLAGYVTTTSLNTTLGNYSKTDHVHNNYALTSHTHNYAANSHTHSEYVTEDRLGKGLYPSGDNVPLGSSTNLYSGVYASRFWVFDEITPIRNYKSIINIGSTFNRFDRIYLNDAPIVWTMRNIIENGVEKEIEVETVCATMIDLDYKITPIKTDIELVKKEVTEVSVLKSDIQSLKANVEEVSGLKEEIKVLRSNLSELSELKVLLEDDTVKQFVKTRLVGN